MATWTLDESLGGRVDFLIAQNGFVEILESKTQLEESTSWLKDHGYCIHRFAAASWATRADMLADIGRRLAFPAYYGMNLDALNDCLSDVAEKAYGWTGSETGLVLSFESFEAFREIDSHAAAALLDIAGSQGQYAALFGNRLLTVVCESDVGVVEPRQRWGGPA